MDEAAPGGAPSAISRSTARRNSTRSASRAFGASVSTAAAALSAGTPLATRSASTASAIVSGGRRTVRSCVRTWGVAPARSAATPASSSGDDALVPRAVRAIPRSSVSRRTAATIRAPGALFVAPSNARWISGSTGRPSPRAESTRATTADRVSGSRRSSRGSCAATCALNSNATMIMILSLRLSRPNSAYRTRRPSPPGPRGPRAIRRR